MTCRKYAYDFNRYYKTKPLMLFELFKSVLKMVCAWFG